MFDGSFAGPGRPKGLKTKPKVLTLTERLAALGFDTVARAVELFNDPTCPHAVKARIIDTIAKLEFPKAIEHFGSIGGTGGHSNVSIKMNMTSGTVAQTVAHTVEQPASLEHAITVEQTVSEPVKAAVEAAVESVIEADDQT